MRLSPPRRDATGREYAVAAETNGRRDERMTTTRVVRWHIDFEFRIYFYARGIVASLRPIPDPTGCVVD
jgi:hypothetical protein